MTEVSEDRPRRFRALVAYDGTDFHGWQVQPNVRTAEGELTQALTQLAKSRSKVQGASRTDAGVHAYGQVMHFDYSGRMTAEQLLRGLNALTARDVRVMHCEETHPRFHARHDACGKLYRYDLWLDRIHHPLFRRTSLQVKARVDLEAVKTAAQLLVGEHDFSSFRAAKCDAKSPELRIERVNLVGETPALSILVEGVAFLKYMVRIIVGTLLEVGRGKRAPQSISDLIAVRDRAQAGDTAQAKGLHLVHVRYPEVPWSNDSPVMTASSSGIDSPRSHGE